MSKILKELILHQEWADAIHWKMFESKTEILLEGKVKDRLYHIHTVQHAYLSIFKKIPFDYKKPEEFWKPKDLKRYAIDYHTEMKNFIHNYPLDKYSEKIIIPWFKDSPVDISFEQAVIQVTTHSHYHRAQNATRFRELGGEPITTDFIMWLWKNRPPAEW